LRDWFGGEQTEYAGHDYQNYPEHIEAFKQETQAKGVLVQTSEAFKPGLPHFDHLAPMR
jgi:hypothetical protein